MNKEFFGIPAMIFVLAGFTALFVVAALFFPFARIENKLDKIDTGIYNCGAYEPKLAPTEASQSATPSASPAVKGK